MDKKKLTQEYKQRCETNPQATQSEVTHPILSESTPAIQNKATPPIQSEATPQAIPKEKNGKRSMI
jgi:hypothetical protein